MLLADAPSSTVPTGYGFALLQSLLALGAVSLFAWLLLRWVARRGWSYRSSPHVRVMAHVPLDARRSLYLVRVAERVLLLGAGDGGAPQLLAELRADEVPNGTEPPPSSFADVLRRIRRPAP